MSSAPTETPRKPRRKWGSIFVILFVVQAFIFISLIAHTSSQARSARDLASHFIQRGEVSYAMTDANRARGLQSQISLLFVAFGVCSLITIAGAVIGLRRPK